MLTSKGIPILPSRKKSGMDMMSFRADNRFVAAPYTDTLNIRISHVLQFSFLQLLHAGSGAQNK